MGIPGDQYCKEIAVTLENGKSHILEFQLHYRRDKWGREAFENGLFDYTTPLHKI